MIDFSIEKVDKKDLIIFLDDGLGDFFLCLPTIRALLKIFGNKLTLLTGNIYSDQLLYDSGIREIIRIDISLDGKKEFNFLEFKNIVSKFDFFINLNTWFPNLIKEDYSVFMGNIRSIGFHNCCAASISINEKLSAFDHNFSIAKMFDSQIRIDDFSPPPYVNKNTNIFINSFSKKFAHNNFLLAIQDWTRKEKMMPKHFFDRLIYDLQLNHYNLIILVLGKYTSIEKEVFDNKKVFFLGEDIPFEYQCGMVSMVDYFVGIDSVFFHVADLFRKQILGLFGPTSEIMWGNRFAKGSIISSSSGETKDIRYNSVYQEIDKTIRKGLFFSEFNNF